MAAGCAVAGRDDRAEDASLDLAVNRGEHSRRVGVAAPRVSDFLFSLPSPRRTPIVASCEEEVLMEVVHVRCAGLDISKKDAKVCVRIAGAGRRRTIER